MNPNTEYERFTREIYLLLAQTTQVKSTKCLHNVKLEGLSGQMHQIDVYWEYEKDGIAHRVAIECKNYNRRVSLEKVCAFKGVLDDLDGVTGIMVSKVGFQKGAKKFARQYRISLKELRHPGYGETIIGEIESHIHQEVCVTLFWIDEDWAIENGFDIPRYVKRLSLLYTFRTELWDSAPYYHLDLKDGIIRDKSGNEITTMTNLNQQIPNHPTPDFPYTFKFDEAFVDSRYFGLVKIKEILIDYKIKDETKILALDAGVLVKAILKDAQSNETDFIALHL